MLKERGSILHTAHILYIYSWGKLVMLFYFHCNVNSTFINMLSTAYIFINTHICEYIIYRLIHKCTHIYTGICYTGLKIFLKKIESTLEETRKVHISSIFLPDSGYHTAELLVSTKNSSL